MSHPEYKDGEQLQLKVDRRHGGVRGHARLLGGGQWELTRNLQQ